MNFQPNVCCEASTLCGCQCPVYWGFMRVETSKKRVVYPLVNKHSFGQSPFIIGKSTLTRAIFNSYIIGYILVYGRVMVSLSVPWSSYRDHFPITSGLAINPFSRGFRWIHDVWNPDMRAMYRYTMFWPHDIRRKRFSELWVFIFLMRCQLEQRMEFRNHMIKHLDWTNKHWSDNEAVKGQTPIL